MRRDCDDRSPQKVTTMKLSSPIYHLKHRAKRLSRDARIPLHAALDQVAAQEGYKSWSMLAQRSSASMSGKDLYQSLQAGDLVLIGARPGHGKTLLSLEILIEAMKDGKRGLFFSLDYNEKDVASRFDYLGTRPALFSDRFVFDSSDAISASYVAERLSREPAGSFAVIDYLQILDQKRDKPELMVQINALKAFAREHAMTIICISQVDRSFDAEVKLCPDLDDVRLPNPLDLSLFNKTCFLNNGTVRLQLNGN
ncbi:replicative DNA helicase [Ochrobactrum sp. 19YEA23]|nr:replicative DNA helicase [Ochrobactrum sp. 19YEA23]